MKRAVVTGGAGFIGSHVAERLGADGVDVLVIDDLSTGLPSNLDEVRLITGRDMSFVRCDLSDAACGKAIAEFRPDVIFHLAAQANVRKSVQDPMYDAHVNVTGTIALLEAAREHQVQAFVFSSTGGAVYGEQDRFPADEEHRTRPECPYGVSKRAGELYLEYSARTFGFLGVTLRYSNVYGPRQNPKGEAGVVAVFAERLLAGLPLTVNGDGDQTRDFVFVRDVVRANVAAAEACLSSANRPPYSVYNVGCGRETSVNDIVRDLREIWPRLAARAQRGSGAFEVVPGPAPLGEQRRSVIDAARIGRELGWKPEVGLSEGLSITMQSFLDRAAGKGR